MLIQENRLLLERALAMISQKAYEFISKAIDRTLQGGRLGDIQSEDDDRGRGRGPRGASASETGVSVLEYPTLARYTEQVAFRASRF